MRFLFLVTGLGEAAQGTAVASYARARGTNIKFVSTTAQCHDHIAAFGFEDILYSGELPKAQLRSHVNRVIEDYAPDAIFCCNSKTTEKMFHPEGAEERPRCLIVSLDSNWLFEDMPAFFDRFFVVFPREIFQRNRNYVVDDERVQPVGFVPSGYEFNQKDIDSCKSGRLTRTFMSSVGTPQVTLDLMNSLPMPNTTKLAIPIPIGKNPSIASL